MSNNTSHCFGCGSSETHSILQVPDPLAPETRTFHLMRCTACGLVHTSPHLNIEEIGPYYQSGYWHPASADTSTTLLKRFEQSFIRYRMRRTMRPLQKWLKPGEGVRVLDFGCGNGDMMALLSEAGYDAHGLDVLGPAVEAARQIHGDKVFGGTLTEAAYPGASFDAVTLYHALEHVQDPAETLGEIQRILKPGGFVLVEVPNIESIGFRLFGQRWYSLHIPQHLFHFAPGSLSQLMARLGFRVVQIGHFSPRASAAPWVLSLFPALRPSTLRARQAQGHGTTMSKLLYFGLQMLALPIALGCARLRKGDVVAVVAVKL